MNQKTLTEMVKEGHDEMYEYYTEYNLAHQRSDFDSASRWAHQFTWEVARQIVGEEIILYPLMEKHMGEEGKRLADEDREQHQRVKELLHKLESLKPVEDEYHATLKKVMEHLKPHCDSEEQKDLQKLEPILGEEGSKKAAKEFNRTKAFAPTRAHPSAPNRPPFETLVSFINAPIDKLKDAFTAFPTEEMKEHAEGHDHSGVRKGQF